MRIERRDFLAGVIGAKALAGDSGYAPILAAQAYVWTQVLRKQKRTLAEGVEDVIAGTRAAGFENTELMSAFFTAELGSRTIALLKQHNLKVPIVYNGGPMHTRAAAGKTIAGTLKLADTIRDTGARVINFNPNPKARKTLKTERELEQEAGAVTTLGVELHKKGFELILHHHDPAMKQNAREWHYLLKNTNLRLCVDTHWVYRGGQDPMEIVREAGSRLASLHLRNSRDRVWMESFGDGDIDYRPLAAYLKEIRYRGYLVIELAYEKDTRITRPLEEDLRLSREYAEQVFGL